MKKPFRRHFRIYFKNNHPAYIVDEEDGMYVYHKITHSKTSGGRKNWKIDNNPIKWHSEPMYVVKQEKRDLIGRFSKFEIELKRGVDVSYPEIKKTGRTQPQHNDGRATISSGNNIKANIRRKNNKRYKK